MLLAMPVAMPLAMPVANCIWTEHGYRVKETMRAIALPEKKCCSSTNMPAYVKQLRSRSNWEIKQLKTVAHIFYQGVHVFTAKRSQIRGAGWGLYAAMDFPKNKMLGYYEGTVLMRKKGTRDKPTYDYRGFRRVYKKPAAEFDEWVWSPEGGSVMQIGNEWVDGSRGGFSGMNFINDPFESTFTKNVQLGCSGQIKTRRKITKGEELFMQYSRYNTYWRHRI